jgi:hypothetical protein
VAVSLAAWVVWQRAGIEQLEGSTRPGVDVAELEAMLL